MTTVQAFAGFGNDTGRDCCPNESLQLEFNAVAIKIRYREEIVVRITRIVAASGDRPKPRDARGREPIDDKVRCDLERLRIVLFGEKPFPVEPFPADDRE